MKKTLRSLLCAILIAAAVLLFASCFPIYKADPKTFSLEGMQITLTEAFQKSNDDEGLAAFYVSADAALAVQREKFKESEFVGIADLTEEDYAELIALSVDVSPRPTVSSDGSLFVLEYAVDDAGQSYSYFLFIRKSADSFWTFEFFCFSENYTELRPYFHKWAKTVFFDS